MAIIISILITIIITYVIMIRMRPLYNISAYDGSYYIISNNNIMYQLPQHTIAPIQSPPENITNYEIPKHTNTGIRYIRPNQ